MLAGVAALASSALAAPRDGAPPAPDRAFTPPQSDLILSRTVWKSLSDGKHIMVRRRYAVRIVAEDGGYVVNGQEIDATVEAPAAVALIAEYERNRKDAGPFPIRLDPQGQIRAQNAVASDPAARAELAERAARVISGSALSSGARQQASGMIGKVIAGQGAFTPWPEELFSPEAASHAEQRTIPLPDGREGEVEVAVKVSPGRLGVLPEAVERTVITRYEGDQRVSRELYTLALK